MNATTYWLNHEKHLIVITFHLPSLPWLGNNEGTIRSSSTVSLCIFLNSQKLIDQGKFGQHIMLVLIFSDFSSSPKDGYSQDVPREILDDSNLNPPTLPPHLLNKVLLNQDIDMSVSALILEIF